MHQDSLVVGRLRIIPRRYETLESIRQRSSMSQKLSRKDKEYGKYSGAHMEMARKMALIDVLHNYGFNSPIIKFYRAFLNQQRKAFFAATCSEISKLGFMLGLPYESIKVGK